MALSHRSRAGLVSPIVSHSTSVVSLEFLGGASVKGSDGPVEGRGVRGRRLALLALLAAARGRPVTRDKLLAMLWPEADSERGRHLLSDSLYMVRSALGDTAIVATGDELRLSASRVSSDTETFERLLDEQQLERAVALYSGPFLDGFHIADAPEFERWLDGERARLAHRFGAALEVLADTSERQGDRRAAVRWLRRLAAHDPYASRIAARLMRAYEADGNRAASLQHARDYMTLFRADFGAEPDPEIALLVERLKSEPIVVPALPRAVKDSQPTPTVPRDHSIIAIAPRAAGVRRSSWTTTHAARRAVMIVGLLGIGAAGVAVLRGGVGNVRLVSATSGQTPPVPSRSIAVLPFDDVGPRRDDAYFSDGLTEEVIGALSQLQGLRVAARASSFALRGTKLDARTIGDTLRVGTLLEGSVRREGNRVRVTAQLVDASNGYQIWSKSYDRRLEDVIALQGEIATAIVVALELQLAPSDARTRPRPPPNAESYDLYLRGVFARNKLTGEELRKAVAFFDQVIRLDSTYAPAYAEKAATIAPLVWFGYLPREEGFAELRRAALRAVALDDSLGEAHVALGMIAFFHDWDWAAAEREFRRAIALNQNDSHAHHFLANFLKAMGRVDEAIAERTRALELDPLSIRSGMLLGSDYFVQGQYELAAKHYRRASEMAPQSPIVLDQGPGVDMGIGHVYERQGRHDAAVHEYLKVDSLSGVTTAELMRLRRAYQYAGIRGYWRLRTEQTERGTSGHPDPVRLSWMWARAGDTDRAVGWVQRAYRERSIGLVFLGVIPGLDGVRRDSRVAAILNAMRLHVAAPAAERARLATSMNR